jgi:hypothetical protein
MYFNKLVTCLLEMKLVVSQLIDLSLQLAYDLLLKQLSFEKMSSP